MKTYIIIAEESERDLINELVDWDIIQKAKVIVTGVGGLNVIESLKKLSKRSTIVNVGYVGSNNLDPGTNLIVGRSSLYHPNVRFNSPVYDLDTLGRDDYYSCFTANDFVLFTKVKATVVFDMELAYICALGFKKVISYKEVSDKLNYKQYKTVMREKE